MPRCRHGSFQDTEYGIHGNQYDMFLVHFQSILKKSRILCHSYTEAQKRETTLKAFLTYGLQHGRRERPKFLTCKNYLEDDYLEEISKCTVLSKSGKVAVEKYKVLRMM